MTLFYWYRPISWCCCVLYHHHCDQYSVTWWAVSCVTAWYVSCVTVRSFTISLFINTAVWQLDMSAVWQRGRLRLVCLSTQLHVLFVERCFNCNSVGHFARDCPEERKRCYNCNKLGHLAKDCPAHQQPRMSSVFLIIKNGCLISWSAKIVKIYLT